MKYSLVVAARFAIATGYARRYGIDRSVLQSRQFIARKSKIAHRYTAQESDFASITMLVVLTTSVSALPRQVQHTSIKQSLHQPLLTFAGYRVVKEILLPLLVSITVSLRVNTHGICILVWGRSCVHRLRSNSVITQPGEEIVLAQTEHFA